MLGLYVHVPFCSAICNYCNFNRGLFDESLKTRYVAALIAEIRRENSSGDPMAQHFDRVEADTLYFGGGTPSLLTAEEIRDIIDACRFAFALASGAEITLEANPETVDARRLAGFREAGVNRLSFGVQTFRDEELRRLDRLHSSARAADAVAEARAAGFDNVSLDLMMWLPQQTVEQWMASVERAAAISPEHLSLYMLEVYPHLPLRQAMVENQWDQLPDEAVAEMYEQSLSRLEAAGYEQYEISNVARPGRRSRHNLKYWTDGEWLGFGPGAHSTRHDSRWRNVASTEDYINRMSQGAPVVAERHHLAAGERLGDALFTGLRLNDGIDLSIFSTQYGVDIWQRFGEALTPYLQSGLLLKDGDRVRLTRQGMLMAHEVMAVFV